MLSEGVKYIIRGLCYEPFFIEDTIIAISKKVNKNFFWIINLWGQLFITALIYSKLSQMLIGLHTFSRNKLFSS